MAAIQNREGTNGMDVDDVAELSEDEEGGTRIGGIYIPPPVPPYCSSESKGPRLLITEIVNENFKSYAGKISLGPFHQSFTAIIGPNGSGKSNVIDSMLFVFGYRAQKIRSKKLSVLLHNSAAFPNIRSCTVEVHFQQILDKPDGSYEKVPNTEFIVSRTAFKDNSSFYTVNGKRVQFKEVSKLLKEHGIDLDHNRFLILQGEVESIAMMKPKGQTGDKNECGLLEYLEDIVGTNRYKEPLIKINEKVIQFTDERLEKHNRCKLAEREIKDLEKPYNDAIEYLKTENQLIRSKNLHIQKKMSEEVKVLGEYDEQKEEILKELQQHNEKYDKLKEERQELEGIVKKDTQEYTNLTKKLEIMEKEHQSVTCQHAEVQSLMESTNVRRKKTMAQVEKEKKNLETQLAMPEKAKAEIEECREKIETLTKDRAAEEDLLATNLASLETETRALNEKREPLENQLIGLQEAVNEDRATLHEVESELKVVQYNETMENRKYLSLKAAYDEALQTMKDKEEKMKEVIEVLPKAREDLKVAHVEIQENKKKEAEFRKELQEVKVKLDDVTTNMQAAQSRDKVLNALMRQKQSGNIPGILGRLGDLGGIDAQYDVAISTCCGRLDDIVVDTVDTAQACIEHLKKHNIGRSTFIALEKVEHFREQCNQRRNYPEGVPRLFDLVRVEDPRVSPAFYFALKETLVATDLEQASRIGYGAKRYRTVSLRGDVIEMSGTMSGGGKQVSRGRMGQKVQTKTAGSTPKSKKEVEGMQIKAEKLQTEINFLQEQQGQLMRTINELTNLIRVKESDEKKFMVDVKSFRQQLPQMKEQVTRQEIKKNQTQSDPERVRELQEQISVKKAALEKSEQAAKKISDQILGINRQIGVITDSKVKAVKDKITDLTKKVEKLSNHVNKMTANLNSADHNRKKLEEKIKSLEDEIEEAANCIRTKNDERTELRDRGVKLTEEIDTLKESISEAKNKNSDITKKITEITKLESKGKLVKVEIDDKLQAVEKKIKEIKDKIPAWQNQLKSLVLQKVPTESEMEPLKTYTEQELSSYTLQDLQYQISVMEEKLKTKANLSVIEEYNKKRGVYLERVQVLEDVTKRRNDFRALYDDVRKKRHNEFMGGFNIISKKLKEMYQMITLGGDAELDLVDSMDPFSEGVMFNVRPPKKSWKVISNLSGGEKTLSSLALVFALHYYKPSPLYVMDEIDAALDFKNVSIVAHYIKERTKNAQFIIISLRSNMFELSNHLVGIYKVNDCTDSMTITNPQHDDDEGGGQEAAEQENIAEEQPDNNPDFLAPPITSNSSSLDDVSTNVSAAAPISPTPPMT